VEYFIGIFFILHGLVHVLYMGHSMRLFELQPNFMWPDQSLILSNIFNKKIIRRIAEILCLVATLGFVVAGIRFFIDSSWNNPEIAISAFLSIMLYVVTWDGSTRKLDNQGGYGILINVSILVFFYINI